MNEKSILIADDDSDLVAVLAHRAQALGLTTYTARDAMTALRMIDTLTPDAAILDVNMPGGNGLAVCELLATGGRTRNMPVIMLTGESQPETVRRCHEMCAYYVSKCPDVWQRVEPLLRELLALPETFQVAVPSDAAEKSESDDMKKCSEPIESSAAQTPSATTTPKRQSDLIDSVFAALEIDELSPVHGKQSGDNPSAENDESSPSLAELPNTSPWILCIDDDPDMSQGIRMRLAEHGVAVRRALGGMEGYRRAFTEPASAIVLDYEMPSGNGDYVLRRLKENPVTCDIPVIVLTGRREKSIERTMYNLGAAAFLNKPYVWSQLWEELQRHVAVPVELTA